MYIVTAERIRRRPGETRGGGRFQVESASHLRDSERDVDLVLKGLMVEDVFLKAGYNDQRGCYTYVF